MNGSALLFGDKDFSFLWSISVRTICMFLIILIFLRLLGKRGVKQLSVFELVVIIGLGSAAGDPMIYEEMGIANAVMAFICIVVCYKIVTYIVFKFKQLEHLIEGRTVPIIKEGEFSIHEFKKESLSKDEFFMELRLQNVYHLGQVEFAFLEISGDISVYFYPDEEIKYGLPIVPDYLQRIMTKTKAEGHYSCLFCGFTLYLEKNISLNCPRCSHKEWLLSSNRKRQA